MPILPGERESFWSSTEGVVVAVAMVIPQMGK
jgi:hypothetical protein